MHTSDKILFGLQGFTSLIIPVRAVRARINQAEWNVTKSRDSPLCRLDEIKMHLSIRHDVDKSMRSGTARSVPVETGDFNKFIFSPFDTADTGETEARVNYCNCRETWIYFVRSHEAVPTSGF